MTGKFTFLFNVLIAFAVLLGVPAMLRSVNARPDRMATATASLHEIMSGHVAALDDPPQIPREAGFGASPPPYQLTPCPPPGPPPQSSPAVRPSAAASPARGCKVSVFELKAPAARCPTPQPIGAEPPHQIRGGGSWLRPTGPNASR